MPHCKSFEKLKPYLDTLKRIHHESSVINYDLETCCPAKGLEEEGELLNYLSGEAAKVYQGKDFVKAVRKLSEDKHASEMEKRLAESLESEIYLLEKMPMDEYVKANEAIVLSNIKWRQYRNAGDYASWAPYFKECVKYSRIMADYRKKKGMKTRYDALLDSYEPGESEEYLDSVFAPLKDALLALLPAAMEKQSGFHYHAIPPVGWGNQTALAYDLLKLIGYDLKEGALRTSMHPFSDNIAQYDSRITTDYDLHDFRSSLFTILHEGGHALEFMNRPQELYDNYVDRLFTSAQAETHSRLYENLIGRNPLLAPTLYKLVRKNCGPTFEKWDADWGFYHALTKVEPGLIRCDADELTYSLHIIIRYEIERDLINGKIEVEDVPAIWNQKYKDYLGIDVPNDKDGCMQDVHWSQGLFGYFPSYALGNLYGAMIMEKMRESVDVDACLQEGNLLPIKEWLAENDYRYDYMKPNDWINKVVGKPLSSDAFIAYLTEKYGK